MARSQITIIASLALLLFASCGNPAGNQKTGNIRNFYFHGSQVKAIGDAEALSISASRVEGTGSLIYLNPITGAPNIAASHFLAFSLLDGGSLTLVSMASSELKNGYEIEFRREGSGPGSLKVRLRADGRERGSVNRSGIDVFGQIDAAKEMRFVIDIHNGESPSRVLVWQENGSNYTQNNSVLDTADDTEKSEGSPGRGNGLFWGARLFNATLLNASIDGAKLSFLP